LDLSYKVADHEGQLKSFAAVAAALQSTLGAWTATAIGIAAAMLAVFTIFGAYQVYFNQKIDAKMDALGTKIDNVSSQFGQDIKSLPDEVTKRVLTVISPSDRRHRK
jgi:hypothetical protein